MKFYPENEDQLLALIRRWCRITGQPYYPGLAQGAVDNMEDFVSDDSDLPIDHPDYNAMKAGDMIAEYIYWVNDPPWKEDPIDPNDPDPLELLDAMLAEMIPDPISIREFVNESTLIVATTTDRMFHVEATDDGAFRVTELDASKFRKAE